MLIVYSFFLCLKTYLLLFLPFFNPSLPSTSSSLGCFRPQKRISGLPTLSVVGKWLMIFFFFFPNNVKLWDQRPGTWNSGQGSGAKILNDAGNIGDPSFSHCKVRELNTLL